MGKKSAAKEELVEADVVPKEKKAKKVKAAADDVDKKSKKKRKDTEDEAEAQAADANGSSPPPPAKKSKKAAAAAAEKEEEPAVEKPNELALDNFPLSEGIKSLLVSTWQKMSSSSVVTSPETCVLPYG